MRTRGQRFGDAAEALVAGRLAAAGWTILGRQLHVGRSEIDILAIDPGPPVALVAIEVRWRARRDYGLAEETVDRRKIRRVRVALWELRDRRTLPAGTAIPRLPARVDLVAVEPDPRGGPHRVRHHRGVG